MLRLAKAFLDIALWKKTPAHLPASQLSVGLADRCRGAAGSVGRAAASRAARRHSLRIVLGVGMPLAFAWAVLSIAKRGQRFLQTAIALLGVGVLAEIVLYPLGVAAAGPRRGQPHVDSPGVFVGGRLHLVLAGVRQYLARRSGVRLVARRSRSAWATWCCRSRSSSCCCRNHDPAHAYFRHRRHLHGRRGRDRQGRRFSRNRIGSECVSAHEHAAARLSASISCRDTAREQLDLKPDIVVVGNALSRGSPVIEAHARPRHGLHLGAAVARRTGAAR